MNSLFEIILHYTFLINTLETFFDKFKLYIIYIKYFILKYVLKKENVINLYTYSYKKNSKNNEVIKLYEQIHSTKNLSNIILDKKNHNEIINDIHKFKSVGPSGSVDSASDSYSVGPWIEARLV